MMGCRGRAGSRRTQKTRDMRVFFVSCRLRELGEGVGRCPSTKIVPMRHNFRVGTRGRAVEPPNAKNRRHARVRCVRQVARA